ncbi:hypothetical protein JAAARDRAFT_40186 [Jaapia argillacea MUCL 33604]|uniref:Uncharacterized protein n=1 Tax=Jaapia argillacea MUCL 33604 TaxID=933084 RepID=A0A067PCV0_9AGAM|nr:hypothetical protein JAAARDRAFT_40186 [Jaapia argillacea MUCL 33604]
MHILTGCDSDGQLTQTYWYHREKHRFTNAFTIKECEAPEWMQSSAIRCWRPGCCSWWNQTQ